MSAVTTVGGVRCSAASGHERRQASVATSARAGGVRCLAASGHERRPASAATSARARGKGSPRQGEQSRHAASQRVGIGPRGAEEQRGEDLYTKFGSSGVGVRVGVRIWAWRIRTTFPAPRRSYLQIVPYLEETC